MKGLKIFLIGTMLIGITLMLFGVRNIYDSKIRTKDFIPTNSVFVESSIYSSDEDGTTYRLTYSYKVKNERYLISTDYGSGSVPAIGTIKTIKYNPNNPSDAIFEGFDSNFFLIFFGLMFAGIPGIMYYLQFGKVDKTGRLPSIIIGLFFIIIGAATYCIMCAGGNSLSITAAYKAYGLWIAIPIIFIIVGITSIFRAIFNIKAEPKESKLADAIMESPIVESFVQSAYDENSGLVINTLNGKPRFILSIISLSGQFISCLFFIVILIVIYVNAADNATRLSILPFLIIISILFIVVIISIIRLVNEHKKINPKIINNTELISKMDEKTVKLDSSLKIANNVVLLVFFGCLFIFLTITDISIILSIKDSIFNNLFMVAFTIPFWVVGIIFLKKKWKK